MTFEGKIEDSCKDLKIFPAPELFLKLSNYTNYWQSDTVFSLWDLLDQEKVNVGKP